MSDDLVSVVLKTEDAETLRRLLDDREVRLRAYTISAVPALVHGIEAIKVAIEASKGE